MAIYRCRKITIAAVNGNAVSPFTRPEFLLTLFTYLFIITAHPSSTSV